MNCTTQTAAVKYGEITEEEDVVITQICEVQAAYLLFVSYIFFPFPSNTEYLFRAIN